MELATEQFTRGFVLLQMFATPSVIELAMEICKVDVRYFILFCCRLTVELECL